MGGRRRNFEPPIIANSSSSGSARCESIVVDKWVGFGDVNRTVLSFGGFNGCGGDVGVRCGEKVVGEGVVRGVANG